MNPGYYFKRRTVRCFRRSVALLLALLCVMAIPCMGITAYAADISCFEDVSADSPYSDAISLVYENGYMVGYADGSFHPDDGLTRAQVVQILYNIEGQPTPNTSALAFTDVRASDWCAKAVIWAYGHGVTRGTGDASFSPQRTVTPRETAAFVERYVQAFFPEQYEQLAPDAAIRETLTSLRESPAETVTRAEMAQILAALHNDILADVSRVSIGLRLYGSGSAALDGDLYAAGLYDNVVLRADSTYEITLDADDGAFISYYVLGDNTPVYLGYTLDDSDSDGILDSDRYTFTLDGIGDGDVLRVYFVDEAALADTVNPYNSTTSYHNGKMTVEMALLAQVYDEKTVDKFCQSSKYDDTVIETGIITSVGTCSGITILTAMLENPQMSGISPAAFSDDESYTAIAEISGDDAEHVTGYGLTMREMASLLQAVGLFGAGAGSETLALTLNNVMTLADSQIWEDFFRLIDSYEQTHQNAVYLSIYSDGSGHAVLVTGVDGWEDYSQTITLSVLDPNRGESEVVLTNSGAGEYKIESIVCDIYGDKVSSLHYYDCTSLAKIFVSNYNTAQYLP